MIAVFEVEHAGCPSCAERVRTALAPLGDVHSIEIDESADTASVRLVSGAQPSEGDVNDVLASASAGSGHAYRVAPGSWRTG